LGGGLRDIVPAPRGILAVGDGAWREAGVVGDATDPATDTVGVTGFMCRPDVHTGAVTAG
jgi:hypothetical protein